MEFIMIVPRRGGLCKIPEGWSSHCFQVGEHAEGLGHWCAQSMAQKLRVPPTYPALWVSSIWVFICILFHSLL